MLFNSIVFLGLFFPITLGIFYFLNRFFSEKLILIFLIIFSLIFYGYWELPYCSLLIGSILFNYILGRYLAYKKLIFSRLLYPIYILTITVNLCILAIFKYIDFIILNINFLIGSSIKNQQIELPLAISFFTFQQIAFITSVYRGEIKKFEFLKYFLFVSFFPQLIAGPIVRFHEFYPQLLDKWKLNRNIKNILIGLMIFSIGMFKKIILADNLAIISDPIFLGLSSNELPSTIFAWIGLVAFTFQIYFDFSGYSDMAIGLALCFGIKLPDNFLSPYKATSLKDFWRCWHITLSKFLRDHIYIPLGGNKNGNISITYNILITMILGGLWHGASWNFILWGAYHGSLLSLEKFLLISKTYKFLNFNKIIFVPIVFLLVTLGWIPFRCEDFQSTLTMLSILFGKGEVSFNSSTILFKHFFFLIACLSIVWFMPNTKKIKVYIDKIIDRKIINYYFISIVILLSFIIFFIILSSPAQFINREFIYFKF